MTTVFGAWRTPARFHVVLIATLLGLWGCNRTAERTAADLVGGDPQQGKQAIVAYGCPSCHTIPGIRGANGLVGPPLNQMAKRVYIAGKVPNTPANLVQWLRDPQALAGPTIMPEMGVTESDARDIASYLYTLR